MKQLDRTPRKLTFKKVLVSILSLLGVGFLQAQHAEVFLGELEQEYDGSVKFPQVSTDPPGLQVGVEIVPRSQSGLVFSRIPEVDLPSYQGFPINGNINKGLGDVVNLGGGNRRLESIDVALVNWARAASWPDLAAANPAGYAHPITVFVYRVQGESLFLLTQKTEEFLVPWRPATLDDGGEFPFNGQAFRARFDFTEEVTLSGKIAILVAYNTENAGFEPTGVAGPFNQLNVALTTESPTVGSDDDPAKMLRYVEGVSRSSAFGAFSPMFAVRTFPANPTTGSPVGAGGYLVTATVEEPGFTGQAVGNLVVTPIPVNLELVGMLQAADGTEKLVSAVTSPADLPFDVVYAKRENPPVERGEYPVFVTLKSGNYAGQRSGIMRLGYSFESWIVDQGVPPNEKGREDDPDLDGVSNFQEYLAATDPGDPTEGKLNLLTLTQEEDSVSLEFVRNNEAADVEHVLESSGGLGNEAAWMELPLPSWTNIPFIAREIVEVPLSISPHSKRFFRLRSRVRVASD